MHAVGAGRHRGRVVEAVHGGVHQRAVAVVLLRRRHAGAGRVERSLMANESTRLSAWTKGTPAKYPKKALAESETEESVSMSNSDIKITSVAVLNNEH